MEPIRSAWCVRALPMVPGLKRRGEKVLWNAKQGFGGKHSSSEGSRQWQEALGSDLAKGSQLAVRSLCILSIRVKFHSV